MKKISFIILFLALAVQVCNAQSISQKEIYNKDFKWKITVPENLITVSAEDWDKMKERGKKAISQTFTGEADYTAIPIFVFKSDETNYFEANYQPFDATKHGNYQASLKPVNDVLYDTFKSQIPNVKLDTVSSVETIDGLKFNVFKMAITLPNMIVMDFLMFNRLFDKRGLTINILTIDKEKQKMLLDALRNSKFEK